MTWGMLHAVVDEAREAPEEHPLKLWIARQRAAWFARWKGVFLALLVLWALHIAFSIAGLVGQSWTSNLPAGFWDAFSIATKALLLTTLAATNLSVSFYGAAIARVPDDLEVALPVGQSTKMAQAEFRRVTLLVVLALLISPTIAGFAMQLFSYISLAIERFGVPTELRPGSVDSLIFAGLLGVVANGVAAVIVSLVVIDLHAWLNLRYWGVMRWDRVLVPVLPLVVQYVFTLAYYYIATALGYNLQASNDLLLSAQVMSAAGALAIWFGVRWLAARELHLAVTRRG